MKSVVLTLLLYWYASSITDILTISGILNVAKQLKKDVSFISLKQICL